MFMYSNSTGNHLCGGMEDMRKADGYATNYAPRIVFDEEGALVGVQGGSLELTKSFGIIANLKTQREEEILRKSQKKSETLKKSFKPARPLHRTISQQNAASRANQAGFTKLLATLDEMQRDQNKFMKSMSW